MEYEPCLQDGQGPSIKKLSGPDGLEAWCVALAACFINFVMAGLARMSGILFVAFIDIFQIERRQASLPFSIRMSVRSLLGPIVGILGQKYGVRSVTLLGAIAGTASAAVCFFATDMVWITIIWGVVNGIGSSLLTTLPQVVIGQHFKKHRTTASGMAFSGGCFGSFLFPALLEFFLHTYGLGGTFLMISGIMMHTIPAAMMLRKPTWLKQSRNSIKVFAANAPEGSATDRHLKNAQTGSLALSNSNADLVFDYHETGQNRDGQNGSVAKNKIYSVAESFSASFIDCEILRANSDAVVDILALGSEPSSKLPATDISSGTRGIVAKDVYELCDELECYQSNIDSIENTKNKNVLEVESNDKKMANIRQEKSLTCFGKSLVNDKYSDILLAIQSVARTDETDILAHFPEEKHGLISRLFSALKHISFVSEERKLRPVPTHAEKETASKIEDSCDQEKSNSFHVHIRTLLKLHLKPLFIMICLCRCVHFLMLVTVLTTVVDFSMDKGLREEDGKYVIAALSAGDLLGRLCLGWVTDKGYVTIPKYMLLVMILQGASSGVLSLVESRASLLIAIAVFGLLEGSVFVRQPVVISMYLNSQEQSIAMGSVNFFPGLMGFILPSYIGYFRDTIGSYNGIFYINGGFGILVGLLWAFEPYFRKFSKPEDIEEPTEV